MRLLVENEDGKAETVFVPAMAVRDAQTELGVDLDDDGAGSARGYDTAVFCAWWVWSHKGWTTAATWEDFAATHSVVGAPDADPSQPSA